MGKSVRLDKLLADVGAGTRSEVKKFIQKGQVQVNGFPVKQPQEKVDPEKDQVSLNGVVIGTQPEFVYYLLHKPQGCISATEDNRDKTVMEYVPSKRKGLFPVGRLDKDTEGLLLITDDGALAHALLSPKRHVEKTYFARVEGLITQDDIHAVEKGLDIGEDKLTLPARLEIADLFPEDNRSEIYLTICEGKFHQVKRMIAALGKKVTYLKRLSMGPLTLSDDLAIGDCRPLTEQEVDMLKTAVSRPQEK